MDSDLSIRDISMTFDDDDTVIRSMSDEGDEDEAVLTRLPSHQWKDIIDFLTVEDFKALRLTGSKVSFCMACITIKFFSYACICIVSDSFYALVHIAHGLFAHVIQ